MPSTCSFVDLVLVQGRSNPDLGNGTSSTIKGNAGTALDGAIYFPNGNLTFSGSSGGSTQCAMIIGWNVTFTGSSDIQNTLTRPDGTPCRADTRMNGKRVRLIA